MGLPYLRDKSWEHVSREERFFCQHLYNLAKPKIAEFVGLVSQHANVDLDRRDSWELAYEACFYRDYFHYYGRPLDKALQKRTFDLLLLSANMFIIIEAKAQQGFKGPQLADFERDRRTLERIKGIPPVKLVGLVSSRYAPADATQKHFDGLMHWDAFASAYDADPILQRADDIYGK